MRKLILATVAAAIVEKAIRDMRCLIDDQLRCYPTTSPAGYPRLADGPVLGWKS